jgi:hypothetical protein
MARGWESKSVESQQHEDLGEAPRRAAGEDPEHARKRESLELSRRRITRELETAKSAVHRTALENALAHLDGELAKLR